MRLLALCLLSSLALASSAQAQWRIQGVGPDLQIAGGVGLGLGRKLDNAFLGRLRLGALYAFEPYWVDAGMTVEVGALSDLAIGGELEWNEFHGLFANAGVVYAKGERVVSHVTVGYTIFGLEWQHAFESAKPHDALLLTVRFPLGFWWFTSGRDERPFAPPKEAPTSQPSAAEAESRGTLSSPRPLGPTQPAPAQPTPATETEAQRQTSRALADAAYAGARNDHAAVSEALRRAYAAQPDPMLWLKIADADLARGKLALAAEDLSHFLGTSGTPEALAQRPAVEARLQDLLPKLARLRVTLEAASGDELIELDGVAQPGAAAGYDVLIDPGSHRLVVRRAGAIVLEREFVAAAGEVVRLSLPLAAAGRGR